MKTWWPMLVLAAAGSLMSALCLVATWRAATAFNKAGFFALIGVCLVMGTRSIVGLVRER